MGMNMGHILIVDDEKIAVEGITQCIDWPSINVESTFAAYNVEKAKALFLNNRIDVLIADIEMPGANGIELLEWVKANQPSTKTIFLTGHADFHYAQQAIRLGSFDYILKPVNHEHLKECVRDALEECRQEQTVKMQYEKYNHLWDEKREILVERFWQDIFSERLFLGEEQLQSLFSLYKIALQSDDKVLPVLISVDDWDFTNNTNSETRIFALKKLASEIVLMDMDGDVVEDQNHSIFILMYVNKGMSLTDAELRNRCQKYIDACFQYFSCRLSCFIGEPTTLKYIQSEYRSLFQMKRHSVTISNGVVFNYELSKSEVDIVPIPSFMDWLVLFETGKKRELLLRIHTIFAELKEKKHLTVESLEAIYYGTLYIAYYTIHKNGLSFVEIYETQDILDCKTATRSISILESWTVNFITKGINFLSDIAPEKSALIKKTQQYIMENIDEDLTREAIASHVYLNPSYLSRLFKKETGQTLTDYILGLRMHNAKIQLENSNQNISQIAASVGYSHFSHFTKAFKKVVGLTPHEYRKKFQNL